MLFTLTESIACNASCASGGGIGNIGLMGNLKNNSISLISQQLKYRSSSFLGNSSTDEIALHTFMLRYNFSDKMKLIAQQDYVNNKRIQDESVISISGFGDTEILLGYTLLNKENSDVNRQHFLEINGGARIPVGQFDNQIHDRELPLQFNPGRASFSALLQMNWMIKWNVIGLSSNWTYRKNSLFEQEYLFGDQLSSNLFVFLEMSFSNSIGLMPTSGFIYEYANKDTYQTGLEVPESGLRAAYIYQGLNVSFQDYLLGLTYYLPFSSYIAEDTIQIKAKGHLQLIFRF